MTDVLGPPSTATKDDLLRSRKSCQAVFDEAVSRTVVNLSVVRRARAIIDLIDSRIEKSQYMEGS